MGYIKNTWVTGDVITAEKMNNIEDGIELLSNLQSEEQEGSGLPAVTELDNGKILQVVNGAWKLVVVEFGGSALPSAEEAMF